MRLNIEADLPPVGPLGEADPLPPEDRAPPPRADDLDRLYRRHWQKLVRFIRRWGPPDQAQDIAQQVFAKLAGSGAGPSIAAPDAYLRQAARNLLHDEARAAARRSAHLHICAEDVPLAAPDPVASLEARDMLQRFEAAVARLAPRTREIFLAHRIDGYSYGEIAFRTGLSVKTVEKHMSRAIDHLGRQFGP